MRVIRAFIPLLLALAACGGGSFDGASGTEAPDAGDPSRIYLDAGDVGDARAPLEHDAGEVDARSSAAADAGGDSSAELLQVDAGDAAPVCAVLYSAVTCTGTLSPLSACGLSDATFFCCCL